jgi:SAM-dependent methyltransferase
MIPIMNTYLTDVRDQYEDYPYPLRDPEDEKKRLLMTHLDPLGKINHFCCKGKLQHDNMRVLVAGGGTGDAAIYLAEQLRGQGNARVVYLDISESSINIAKQRAAVRQLDNIEWRHGSILDVPAMEMAPFDYINCCGVLHHLADPAAGLKALKDVLRPGGAMGIMVYGKYGRTAIYQIQNLLRLINDDTPAIKDRLVNTKETLNILAKTNWWYIHDHKRWDITTNGDTEIYDLFLHAQDRAYSVPELYEWVEQYRLELVAFAENAHHYVPANIINDAHLLSIINRQPLRNQQAIAELMIGIMRNHSFYVSDDKDCMAELEELENVPYFFDNTVDGPGLARAMDNIPAGKMIEITLTGNTRVRLAPRRFTREILSLIDGNTPLEDIFAQITRQLDNQVGNEELLADFRPVYQTLVHHTLLLLRHKSVPAYATSAAMGRRVSQLYQDRFD